MGTGYTRNDASNNIANGNVIDAADLDGEFDAIEAAFSTSGHTHDGTSEEGGAITVVGPTQEFLGDGSSFYPKADAVYDLGKSTASFDIAYVENVNLAGTALTASGVEINYVDGVTSSIQTQLDNKLPLAGGTLTGNVNFGDNDKAIFGAGSDLSIYHSSSTPGNIIESATNNLYIRSNSLYFQNAGGTENNMFAISDGAVSLAYDNNVKLATTSTGIDVTGSITSGASGGLIKEIGGDTSIVQGAVGLRINDTASAISPTTASSNNDGSVDLGVSNIRFRDLYLSGTATVNNALFSGYIDFQTGGVNKGNIYTDASTMIINTQGTNTTLNTNGGNVGIGSTSPDSVLHLKKNDSTAYSATSTNGQIDVGPTIYLENPANSNSTVGGQIVFGMRSTEEQARIGATGGTAPSLTFGTGDAERMRIDSSGNVGIGTDSPTSDLSIGSTTTSSGDIALRTTKTTATITPSNSDAGGLDIDVGWVAGGQGPLTFSLGSTERMRIDSSGRVGIGTSSPSTELQVAGSSAADTGILVTNSRNGVGMALRLDNTNNGTNKGSGIKWESGGFETGAIITRSVGTAASGDAPGYMTFHTSNDGSEDLAERMRIDASGNVLVGTTLGDVGLWYNRKGVVAKENGQLHAAVYGGAAAVLNRNTNDGDIVQFRKAGTSVGSIGTDTTFGILTIAGSNNSGIFFTSNAMLPIGTTGAIQDNTVDLGNAGVRFDDIFATNGTIQTSDATEKQDIASLTATEMLVGKRISALFKTFRWKDSVAEKGDNARTHTGVIAQDVQAAFTAEGLDAGDYSLFISTTWWETQTEVPAVEAVAEVTDEDGNVTTEAVEAKDAYTRTDTYETIEEAPEGATERTRMGIRYPELLCFVGAYNEQRFASIEARLTALEAN